MEWNNVTNDHNSYFILVFITIVCEKKMKIKSEEEEENRKENVKAKWHSNKENGNVAIELYSLIQYLLQLCDLICDFADSQCVTIEKNSIFCNFDLFD